VGTGDVDDAGDNLNDKCACTTYLSELVVGIDPGRDVNLNDMSQGQGWDEKAHKGGGGGQCCLHVLSSRLYRCLCY